MCNECGMVGWHLPGCPHEELTVAGYCDMCDAEIYSGDMMFADDTRTLCEDCIKGMTVGELLAYFDVEGDADDYDGASDVLAAADVDERIAG